MKKLFLFAAAAVGVAVPVAAGVNARAQKLDLPVPAPAPIVCVEEIHSLQGAPTRVQAELEAVRAAQAPAQFHDLTFTAFGGGEDVRVDVDLKDATPREALKHVFDQTKLKHQVDEDVPDEPRITFTGKGIRLSTALSLIAEVAGVNWTIERRVSVKPAPAPPAAGAPRVPQPPGSYETTVVYRIGKKVSPSRMFFGSTLPALPGPALEGLLGEGGMLNVLTRTREERSTFNCPHCKGQTTMIRVKQRASCPKCSRLLQDDWQFCPADGTKRPAAPNEWRYCPICGKNVPVPEKAAAK